MAFPNGSFNLQVNLQFAKLSSGTNPETAAQQVAVAIDAIMAGNAPANQVDWKRGY